MEIAENLYFFFIEHTLFEYFTQFTVTEVSNPALAGLDSHVCEVPLVLNHLINALLEGVLGDETVYDDVLVLSDAVGAVCGLCFHCGVPPEIVVDDVAGSSEVEACASGL